MLGFTKSTAGSRKENVEMVIRYVYFLSVAAAPLGPAVRYSLLILCALLLAFNVAVNGASFRLDDLPQTGRKIFAFYAALALWTAFAALFTFKGLHGYGKNVSVTFELLIGAYFAARTMRTPEARALFIKTLAVVSFPIMVGLVLRNVEILPYFPNRALANGNSLGGLALLLFPPLLCFAFWPLGKYVWAQIVFMLPLLGILFLSFSSGAWLSAFLGVMVFLPFAVKFKKITKEFCLAAGVLCVAAVLCLSTILGEKLAQRLYRDFNRERDQMTAFDDPTKLTTHRDKVWKDTLHIMRGHLLTGLGGDAFENRYGEFALYNGRLSELTYYWLNWEFRQVNRFGTRGKFGARGRLMTYRNRDLEASQYTRVGSPLTETGWVSFERQFSILRMFYWDELRELGFIDHPHSTFLYLVYIGGIPALLFFVGAVVLSFKKLFPLLRTEGDEYFPWALMSLIMLIEILTYGTNGDVFQGRRDISTMVWCVLGIIAVLPEAGKMKGQRNHG